MASLDETIRNILNEHRIWAETIGASGMQVNLSGIDFSEVTMPGINLVAADLSPIPISGMPGRDIAKQMRHAKLQRCSLQQANLKNACLTGVGLSCTG